MAWSQALAVEGRQSPEENVKAIQQVSVADVNRVARKYLNLDQAIVAILTPEASGQPVASSPGHGAVESFTPKQTKPAKLPGWAEKSLKRLSVPASTMNPVVSILPCNDLDDAIDIANDIEYGLSSAIFTDRLQHAERFLSAAGIARASGRQHRHRP